MSASGQTNFHFVDCGIKVMASTACLRDISAQQSITQNTYVPAECDNGHIKLLLKVLNA